MYNFVASNMSSATVDFTQLIWRATTQLGIGIAMSSDRRTVKVIANYYPSGNLITAFAANVLPLCSNASSSG